jgi:hypothetical protein
MSFVAASEHVVIVTPPTLVVGFHFAALDFPSRIEQSIFRTNSLRSCHFVRSSAPEHSFSSNVCVPVC